MILRPVSILFLFAIFIFNISCAKSLLIDDSNNIPKGRGIVFMKLSYKEGFPTYDNITFTIESVDRTFFTKIKIEKNTSELIALELRENGYYFSDVYAVADTSYATADRKEDMPMFYGSVMDNFFEVKAGRINYIGDIIVQTKRKNLGRRFVLVSDSGVKEVSYFFGSHLEKMKSFFRAKYPKLTAKYPIISSKIFYGLEGINRKAIYSKNRESNDYGYGGETYGRDLVGYGPYKWGLYINDFYKLLKEKEIEYNVIDKYIVETTVEGTVVLLYFVNGEESNWGSILYKGLVYSSEGLDQAVDRITKEYGFPKKVDKSFIWELPSTIITLKQGKKRGLSIKYENKEYISAINEDIN